MKISTQKLGLPEVVVVVAPNRPVPVVFAAPKLPNDEPRPVDVAVVPNPPNRLVPVVLAAVPKPPNKLLVVVVVAVAPNEPKPPKPANGNRN